MWFITTNRSRSTNIRKHTAQNRGHTRIIGSSNQVGRLSLRGDEHALPEARTPLCTVTGWHVSRTKIWPGAIFGHVFYVCTARRIRCSTSHMAVDGATPLLLWFRRVWVVETGRTLSGDWLWMPISTAPGRVRSAAVAWCLWVTVSASTAVLIARTVAIGAALVDADAVLFPFFCSVCRQRRRFRGYVLCRGGRQSDGLWRQIGPSRAETSLQTRAECGKQGNRPSFTVAGRQRQRRGRFREGGGRRGTHQPAPRCATGTFGEA